MLEKAKEHFLFLVDKYGVQPKKAKEALDKWFKERDNSAKYLSEFNTWYYTNYPEFNRAKDIYKGDK